MNIMHHAVSLARLELTFSEVSITAQVANFGIGCRKVEYLEFLVLEIPDFLICYW